MLGHPDTYYRPFPHRKESGLCLPPRYQPGMCPSSTCRLQGGRQCASMVGFCFLFFFSPQRCLTCLGTEKPRWLEAKSDYKAVTSCVSEPGVSSNGGSCFNQKHHSSHLQLHCPGKTFITSLTTRAQGCFISPAKQDVSGVRALSLCLTRYPGVLSAFR